MSPETRLLVLEALGQTEAERKYERAPPTAMERELQTFLEDLLKREDPGKGIPRCKRSAGKQQGVAQRHAERARTTHGNRFFSGKRT